MYSYLKYISKLHSTASPGKSHLKDENTVEFICNCTSTRGQGRITTFLFPPAKLHFISTNET